MLIIYLMYEYIISCLTIVNLRYNSISRPLNICCLSVGLDKLWGSSKRRSSYSSLRFRYYNINKISQVINACFKLAKVGGTVSVEGESSKKWSQVNILKKVLKNHLAIYSKIEFSFNLMRKKRIYF